VSVQRKKADVSTKEELLYSISPKVRNSVYFKIVKNGAIAMIKANPKTTIEPGLFLSFQREMEKPTV
jgi:hypothetical protein